MEDHPENDHDQEDNDQRHDPLPIRNRGHLGLAARVTTCIFSEHASRSSRCMTAFFLIAHSMRRCVRCCGRCIRCLHRVSSRFPVCSLDEALEIPKGANREDHSECRDRKREMNAKVLLDDLHYDRCGESTEVDAHVEDVIGTIL